MSGPDDDGLDPAERADAARRLVRERDGPPAVVSGPERVRGTLRFRSLARVPAVLALTLGAAGAAIQAEPWIAAAGAGLALLLWARGAAAVQRLEVGGGEVALAGVLRRTPVPLTAYGWIRCLHSGRALPVPVVVVCYRRPGRHPLAGLRGRVRPSASPRRAVILLSVWRDGDGRLVAPGAVEAVLERAAARAEALTVRRARDGWLAAPAVSSRPRRRGSAPRSGPGRAR